MKNYIVFKNENYAISRHINSILNVLDRIDKNTDSIQKVNYAYNSTAGLFLKNNDFILSKLVMVVTKNVQLDPAREIYLNVEQKMQSSLNQQISTLLSIIERINDLEKIYCFDCELSDYYKHRYFEYETVDDSLSFLKNKYIICFSIIFESCLSEIMKYIEDFVGCKGDITILALLIFAVYIIYSIKQK